MVRDIQRVLGRSTAEAAVRATAVDVFESSNIDLATGLVERANFIDACEKEAFRGTRKLLRLAVLAPTSEQPRPFRFVDVGGGGGDSEDELELASPKARRMSQGESGVYTRVGSPGHVHIRRTAIYRLGVVPHSPATKLKINESLLEAPSPAAGVPDDHLEAVTRVLDTLLNPAYAAPPSGGAYDLLSVAELLATIEAATAAFASVRTGGVAGERGGRRWEDGRRWQRGGGRERGGVGDYRKMGEGWGEGGKERGGEGERYDNPEERE